jgi:hypothetical protein
MYRKPSKRKQLIQRTIIYSSMSLAVVVLVAALLFVVLGYQLNRADGRIEQGGLVQFDSIPSGADVTIDGVGLGFRTATKSTLNAGSHYFTMTKNGYKSWQKSVNLAPGAVLWLNYARLVPNDLKQENVTRLSGISTSAASPDQHWVAVSENSASPTLRLFDISRSDVKTKDLTLPQTAFTVPEAGKTQHFSIETWDPASKYLLVKHAYNDASVEWLVVDTADVAKTKNITALLNIAMSKVLFSNADSNILYIQTGTDIRRVDVNAGTLSRPLVENVAEFNLFDRSTIAFTTLLDPTTKSRMAGYYEDGAEKPHELRSYIDDGTTPLHVALGKYFNEPYIAISYGETVDILRGGLPELPADMAKLKQETKMTVQGGAQLVTMRTNGRFVIAAKDGDYYTYDNELKQQTRTTLKGQDANVSLGWLDEYTAWSDRNGMLRLYEFDGSNQNDIMPVVERQAVVASADDVYIYGVTADTGGGYHLTRARMILP